MRVSFLNHTIKQISFSVSSNINLNGSLVLGKLCISSYSIRPQKIFVNYAVISGGEKK